MIKTNHSQNILLYLLKREALRVKDLSHILECSEAHCSRIVSGKTPMNLERWRNIAEHFEINYDAIFTGLITSFKQDSDDFLKSTAPNKKFCFSSGKLAHQYITYLKTIWGEEAFQKLCKIENVNPLRFVNIANPIDMEFNMRFFQFCRARGHLTSKEDLHKMANFTTKLKAGHGNLSEHFTSTPGIHKLKLFLENVETYEKNHHYVLEGWSPESKALIVSFTPKEHVNKNLYFRDPLLKDVFEDYISLYFQKLAGDTATIERISSHFSGDDRCTIQVFEA